MPTIKTMNLTGPALDAKEVYENGVYSPQERSLERLNGGLDRQNFVAGLIHDHDIKPWAMQRGTFAQGYYHGFDRMEKIYGFQCSTDHAGDAGAQRIPHASLCARVFIPFAASAIMYGFQAWFQHDATKWVSAPPDGGSTGNSDEYWDWRFKIQSMAGDYEAPSKALSGILPFGRIYDGNKFFMPEGQWRYVHKSGMLSTRNGVSLSKGYFSIEFSMAGKLAPVDSADSKVKTVAGGVWILALR